MDIKNRIGLQSSKYNALLLENEINFCINNGFRVFEIFFDDFWPWDIPWTIRKELKELSIEKDITLQVHAPIKKMEPWLGILIETLEFTEEINSNLLTIHPEFEDIILYKYVFSLALEKGIYIGLENYKAKGNYSSARDLIFFNSLFYKFPNIGVTFDTGHANIQDNPEEYLASITRGLKLLNVHLHDNHGETDSHLPLGEGNINFAGLVYILKKMDYRGNFIVEHWNDNLNSVRYFSSLWKKIKNI